MKVDTKKMSGVINKAKRSLFELETFMSAQEISRGKFQVYPNVKDLLAKMRK